MRSSLKEVEGGFQPWIQGGLEVLSIRSTEILWNKIFIDNILMREAGVYLKSGERILKKVAKFERPQFYPVSVPEYQGNYFSRMSRFICQIRENLFPRKTCFFPNRENKFPQNL